MNGAVCVKERKDFDKKTDSENLREAKRAVFALDSYTRARLKSVFSGNGNWVADKEGMEAHDYCKKEGWEYPPPEYWESWRLKHGR